MAATLCTSIPHCNTCSRPSLCRHPPPLLRFHSTGTFALLSGGGSPSNLALYNTCDNSPVTLPAPGLSDAAHVPEDGSRRQRPHGQRDYSHLFRPNGLDFFFGLDNTGIDIIATTSSPGPLTSLCPQHHPRPDHSEHNLCSVHINIGQGTFHPINFFLSPDSTQAYIVPSDRSGVLVYNFNTDSASAIPLVNNAIPIAADITVDGTLIYVAGSDGLLHEVNTALALDRDADFLLAPRQLHQRLLLHRKQLRPEYRGRQDRRRDSGLRSRARVRNDSPELVRICRNRVIRLRSSIDSRFRASKSLRNYPVTKWHNLLLYAVLPKSLATLSSTPLTNCTDSRLENFRAISSASLITTARGVSG